MLKFSLSMTVFLAFAATDLFAKQALEDPIILEPVPRLCSEVHDVKMIYMRPGLSGDLRRVQFYEFPRAHIQTTAIVHLASGRMAAVYGTEEPSVFSNLTRLTFELEDKPQEYSLKYFIREARRQGFDAELLKMPSEIVACFEGRN